MKFTDGYWQVRPGFSPLYATQIDDVRIDAQRGTMTAYVPTARIRGRGDTLNRPMLTVTYSSPSPGVIAVSVTHHAGLRRREPSFELRGTEGYVPVVELTQDAGVLRSGDLEVRVPREGGWRADFLRHGRLLTSSLPKSLASMSHAEGGQWVHEQLALEPAEQVYGLGERFGPFVKNGQTVDIWNEDGGTSSEQAYKNVPLYLTTKGYGVLVDHPGRVSYEVASEVNTRVQFSVAGHSLTYLVIDGPAPKDVLRRYTALTGRPARLPAWSYGAWLSTSFTTSYDEETVNGFVDGMIERGIPLSVVHFDSFWMREYQWCDFEWDPRSFPDPEGMLRRLKAKGLRVCVWINPYIAQRSPLFAEGVEHGYFVRTPEGDVWQWDKWQAGMALVDFTNPEATAWYQGKLRALLNQGVDCFKTDFGERVPVDVVWHDGSDPERMHNYYTHLYNRAVHDLLVAERGEGEAVLFARSATAGGQQYPVHWGGDCDSTYASMAESLRGGLSLSMSGFGFWSHDIGGFEGTPDTGVFLRWLPFGMLSSHSRFHGSDSYRVPWTFGEEAVRVTREFLRLKLSLMPYLGRLAEDASGEGVPVMRPMALEFPGDRGTHAVDTQYMLGDALCVSPVFREDGVGETYLPEGRWTHLLDGQAVEGPRWTERSYDLDSLGLFVRPGTVLPIGAVDSTPEYEWARGVTLRLYEIPDGYDQVTVVPGGTGRGASFHVRREGSRITVSSPDAPGTWRAELVNGAAVVTRAEGDGPGRLDLGAEDG